MKLTQKEAWIFLAQSYALNARTPRRIMADDGGSTKNNENRDDFTRLGLCAGIWILHNNEMISASVKDKMEHRLRELAERKELDSSTSYLWPKDENGDMLRVRYALKQARSL